MMSKNKGQNNANDMKPTGAQGDMSNGRTTMQEQNKSNAKKGATNKTKTSGTQG